MEKVKILEWNVRLYCIFREGVFDIKLNKPRQSKILLHSVSDIQINSLSEQAHFQATFNKLNLNSTSPIVRSHGGWTKVVFPTEPAPVTATFSQTS